MFEKKLGRTFESRAWRWKPAHGIQRRSTIGVSHSEGKKKLSHHGALTGRRLKDEQVIDYSAFVGPIGYVHVRDPCSMIRCHMPVAVEFRAIPLGGAYSRSLGKIRVGLYHRTPLHGYQFRVNRRLRQLRSRASGVPVCKRSLERVSAAVVKRLGDTASGRRRCSGSRKAPSALPSHPPLRCL